MRYATRLSTDADAMTDRDSQSLRDVGFTDRQIVDITLAAAARNYFQSRSAGPRRAGGGDGGAESAADGRPPVAAVALIHLLSLSGG